MIISEEHIKAASVCVDRRIPFALVIPPGAMKSILFASLSDGESALEHGGNDSNRVFSRLFSAIHRRKLSIYLLN